jgi:hypothetical protein
MMSHISQDNTPTPQAAKSFTWHTQYCGKMTIGSMTNSHLANLEAWLLRRISGTGQSPKDHKIMICDDKTRTSFSGDEGIVDYWKDALSHVRVERQSRQRKTRKH